MQMRSYQYLPKKQIIKSLIPVEDAHKSLTPVEDADEASFIPAEDADEEPLIPVEDADMESLLPAEDAGTLFMTAGQATLLLPCRCRRCVSHTCRRCR